MSEKQRLANKQNALRSTGPRSETGKARSKLNATKHGGYANLCLEGEDRVRFKTLLLDVATHYNPSGFEEQLLVLEIAETIWRKNRFKLAEAKAFETYSYSNFGQGEEKGDVVTALAQDLGSYSVIPGSLATEETLDRRLWRLIDRLKDLQEKKHCSVAELAQSTRPAT